MAEIEGSTRLVPPAAAVATSQPAQPTQPTQPAPTKLAITQTGQIIPPPPKPYRLEAREFTPTGESMLITADFPTTDNFNEWSIMTQVVMLKKGTWAKASIPEIMWGVAYAKKLGLDIMAGDVYSVGDGRIATSNKAKIKMAFATGRIKGFDVQFKELTDTPASLAKCSRKQDLECMVTLDVEGLNKPVVRKAKLSAWFNEKNPNWAGRPDHMLELNTMAHACEYVHPTETGTDELPDQEIAQIEAGKAAAATPSVKELREAQEAEKAVVGKVPAVAAVTEPVMEAPLAEVVA